ncbi:MAG: ATP synthase F1 subunit delta [Bacteroidales bacterium]|jgi:F-type H+-transporting ATPase subunit delta|nr:ATP synthase F1 subunit delta [Bacteroidales bacterium]
MNRSIVITRYALALVRYVRETGQGDIVCSEAETLVNALYKVPDLRRMVTAADDVVGPFEKKKLLQTALGNQISPELSRFLTLLNQRGRMALVEDILRDFITIYRRSIGIRKAHLVTVNEPSERLLQRLRALVKQKTGDDVIIEVSVDPSIVGGFVFDLDEYLMDASVKHQLDLIREEFIERNRRII